MPSDVVMGEIKPARPTMQFWNVMVESVVAQMQVRNGLRVPDCLEVFDVTLIGEGGIELRMQCMRKELDDYKPGTKFVLELKKA